MSLARKDTFVQSYRHNRREGLHNRLQLFRNQHYPEAPHQHSPSRTQKREGRAGAPLSSAFFLKSLSLALQRKSRGIQANVRGSLPIKISEKKNEIFEEGIRRYREGKKFFSFFIRRDSFSKKSFGEGKYPDAFFSAKNPFCLLSKSLFPEDACDVIHRPVGSNAVETLVCRRHLQASARGDVGPQFDEVPNLRLHPFGQLRTS